MIFPDLQGNERLKKRIAATLENGALSHACIVCGGTADERRRLAKILASAIVCKEGKVPCFWCEGCRKTMQGIHPDVSYIEPEKDVITVDTVRQMRLQVSIKPNEAENRVYIINDADKLNDSASNAMLKTIEEPPAYAAFILTIENPQSLPETVRSRCVEFRLQPVEKPADENAKKHAKAFAKALSQQRELALAEFAASLEKIERESFEAFLDEARKLVSEAACKTVGDTSAIELSMKVQQERLLKIVKVIDKTKDCSRFNVGVGHMAFALAAECWEELN